MDGGGGGGAGAERAGATPSGPRPGPERRGAAVEEDFRLQHEAVADHADLRPVAEDLPQPSEEFRTIALQFLHPLRQRNVQPPAEVGARRLTIAVALLGNLER